ncbi:MAG TPA: mercuric reductase [Bryobacteraceae bacterium]|nr:mercuric reductase [Bryobacteraceae bacterium]
MTKAPAQVQEPIANREDEVWLDRVHPADWKNPHPKDRYHLVVLGGGYGGILTALEAARAGASVALVERDLLGGTCLNAGCISSKALIRTSRLCGDITNAWRFGAGMPEHEFHADFGAAMERMRHVRARVSRRYSASELSERGIDVFFGNGRFTGKSTLAVHGKELRFKRALIATGAHQIIPDIPGLAEAGYLTNDSVFGLTKRPRRLLVIGGGPFGCELAQAFQRFGSQVTIVQKDPFFLRQEERDAAQILSEAMARDGIGIHLNTEARSIRRGSNEILANLVTDDYETTIAADAILIGVGRAPNVAGLGLEAANVEYDAANGIHINDYLETSNPRIFAAGDVCREHRFAHIEGASAHIVTRNALFLGRQRLSALSIPWCTFTDPEIAHVGMYVTEAREKNIPVRTLTVLMHEVDRAIADGEEEGFVKIHVREGTDCILGATVAARHAGEMISDISLAMSAGIGMRRLACVSHPYPTQAAAIKVAANRFVQTRKPSVRNWLEKLWLKL